MHETSATDSTQAVAILDPNAALASESGWEEQWQQWLSIIRVGILPAHVKTPAEAIALSRAGATYGWSPIQSCTKLNVISGKVTMYAETLMDLIQGYCHKTPGCAAWPVENSAQRGAIAVTRTDWPDPFTFEFTQAQAKTAGLWGKNTWVKYPEAMLWARCVSKVARGAFADVTGGAFVTEEFSSERVTIRQVDDDEPLEVMIAPPAEVPAK